MAGQIRREHLWHGGGPFPRGAIGGRATSKGNTSTRPSSTRISKS